MPDKLPQLILKSYTSGPVSADCTVKVTFVLTYGFRIATSTNGTIVCQRAIGNGAVVDRDQLI